MEPNSGDVGAEIISFFSIWDDELGPEIIDLYPKSNVGDIEKLASQIFTVYQSFWESPDNKYQRTNFVLPINKINRKAKVLFDSIPNSNVRGGFQPYINVILVPDYFKDDQLDVYNEILLKISQDFSKNHEIQLKDYYEDVKKVFAIQLYEEPEIEINDLYSYTAAMEDFQAGIKLFQTKNFDQAYQILRNVLLKFEQEEHKHLIMEVIYIIASLFTQQKQFAIADGYFRRLKKLAKDLNHEKYLETALFLGGFCEFKNEKYTSAKKKLEKIDITKAKFINKLQYYSIYGRILGHHNKFEEALQELLKALIVSTEMEKSAVNNKQQSQILYELGVINYKIAVKNYKELGLNRAENYQLYLQEAINYFKRSEIILLELKDYGSLIQLYQLIGNIFEFLGKHLVSLEYYEKALNCSEINNEPYKKIRILKRIIQKQKSLSMDNETIVKLKEILSNLDQYKFIDLYTIAKFHWLLADSLLAINENNEGLNELINSYEIFRSFKTPIFEEVNLLDQIIDIYNNMMEQEKADYYKEELSKLSNDLKELSLAKPKIFSPMGDIKEIWVFSSSASVEIYNYAPETVIDSDLLGGFLTALQQFSLEITQKEFNNMIIGNDRYMIYQEEGMEFFILGRADARVSIDIVKTILSKIYLRFWKEYSQYIRNFQGNMKYFKNFTDIIESLDLTLTI